nr:MAG TPA: NADH-ubiquinone oxidoreductase B12 subunit family [Caudoviricetes sp.]
MRKQIELTAPAAWINRRYYELQAAESMPALEEEPDDGFKVTLKEGIKIGIGVFTVYIIIAMAIIIL